MTTTPAASPATEPSPLQKPDELLGLAREWLNEAADALTAWKKQEGHEGPEYASAAVAVADSFRELAAVEATIPVHLPIDRGEGQ